MRIAHLSIVRTLVTIVISGCGAGSGLFGIATTGGNGSTGTGAPPVLSFFAPPSSANVGQTMSAVEVLASDSLGSVDTTFTGAVTIALASNSTGAALSGTKVVRAVAGIATFNNLAVDKAGTYTLQASASGAATVTSSPFAITTVTTP